MEEACVRYSPGAMRTALIACCAGAFIMPLASTMLNLALVQIDADFHVGSKSMGMVAASFLLASVMAIVPVSRLSDIFGRKKVFLAGLVITMVSAVTAVFSPNFETLIATRCAMGAGSAAITVSGVALLTEVYPFIKRGWAIGIQSTFIYLGIAIGPTLGGVVCEFLGWRYMFLFMIPVTVVALIYMVRFTELSVSDPGRKMDYSGSVLYGVTILLTMYGVINLPNIWAMVLIAAGLILLLIFIKTMKRAENPILDVSVFRYKTFSRACAAAFMNYGSSYSVSFFLALYLQYLGALSPLQAGLILLIQPVVQVMLTAKFGSYSDRISDKRILPTAGMALTSVAVALILFVGREPNFWYIGMILVFFGLGYALFAAPNTSSVMSSLPPKNRGEASGMISLVRQIGMMTSMGVAMCTIALIMGTNDSLTDPSNWGTFVDVIKTAFVICLGMCIAGTVLSWFRGTPPSDAEY